MAFVFEMDAVRQLMMYSSTKARITYDFKIKMIFGSAIYSIRKINRSSLNDEFTFLRKALYL